VSIVRALGDNRLGVARRLHGGVWGKAGRGRAKARPYKAYLLRELRFCQGSSQGAPFFRGDIDDGDDRSVHLVVQGALGEDFQLIVYPVAVGKLLFDAQEIRHDLQNEGLEILNLDSRIDVQERTSDIAGEQAQGLLGFGREAADGEIASDHDDGNIDAREQIGQVGVDLAISTLQLRSSSLTVLSSSLTDCNSSLAVSSSSLVLWSSSLLERISSLAE